MIEYKVVVAPRSAFRLNADPREINRRVVRSRRRRICDDWPGGDRHFIEPGERYERITVISQGFRHYARCQACMEARS